MSSLPTTCARCGRAIPADAPHGHCPACVALTVERALAEDEAPERNEAPGTPDPLGSPRARIGRYELIEELGRGGMGIVYRARQQDTHREVALKVLDAGFTPPGEADERFLREARVVASLDHPGLVRLYEGGSAGGHRYFAMELIAGRTLETVAREGPLPAAVAARWVLEVARAIAYAHEQRVVHRDLKPSNIIVDPRGRPRVTDFGLARRLDAPALTATRQTLGTPAYMAPEQVRGAPAPLDPRSDLFALGAILYRLVAGRPPFQGETVEAVLLQVLETEPIPLRRLNPLVPPDLEAICQKCLEKHPDRRYPTATALADDLERFLEHIPTHARPIPPLGRLWRLCRRHPGLATLTGALTLAIVAGGTGILWHARQAEAARRETQQANVRLQTLLARRQFEHAENLVRRGDAQAALPPLARILRDDPAHPAAPSRALNLLSGRHHLLPLRPPIVVASNLNFACLSPDGRSVALASWAGYAQVIHLETGPASTPPLRHARSVLRVAFSPDARWLGSTSPDRTARVWNATRGEPVCPPLAHPGNVLYLAFSPDGRRLVTTCEVLATNSPAAHEIAIWDLPAGRRAFPGYPNRYSFHAVAWSPDGRWIAAPSTDRQAHLLDAATGRAAGLLPHDGAVNCVAFSPDSQRLATGSHDGTARLWDPRTSQPLGPPLRHGDEIRSVEFSPDGQSLLTAAGDGQARIFDVLTGQLRISPLRADGPLRSAHFDPPGRRVVAQGDDGVVRIWDAHSGEPWSAPLNHPTPLLRVAFAADGQHLITVGQDGLIQVRDARPGARLPVRLVHDEPVVTAAFGPGPDDVLVVTPRHPVARWNRRTGQRLTEGPRLDFAITRALPGPDAARVLVRRSAREAELWAVAEPRRLRSDLVLSDHETNAAFSADGRWLAVKQPGLIEVLDTATGAPSRHRLATAFQTSATIKLEFCPRGRFLFHHELWEGGWLWPLAANAGAGQRVPAASDTQAARFSPDGTRLATAGPHYGARLFDLATGTRIGPELIHPQFVRAVCFTPDGATLLTVAADNVVRAWNPVTGESPRLTLHPPGLVKRLEVSADGRSALTVSAGDQVTVWDLTTGRTRFPTVRVEEPLLLAEFLNTGRHWITATASGAAVVRDTATGLPLTDTWLHGAPIHHAVVHPDGSQFLMVGDDGGVSLWEILTVTTPAPVWLADLAEALAGERLDETDTRFPVPATAIHDLQAQLANAAGENPYLRWARWFFRDRATNSPAMSRP